jgi:hypothetical protein
VIDRLAQNAHYGRDAGNQRPGMANLNRPPALMRTLSRLICVGALLLQGCVSDPVTVFPLPPAHYEILGRVTGIGCGTLGFFGSALSFIPVYYNSRVERAYQQAVQTLPGTTSLINVTIREDWFWWGIATTRCTVINADAIRGAEL